MWGAAMDVGEWLRGLGLGKYEETFRANAIDAALLPRLTGDDLKEIGVSALGDAAVSLTALALTPKATMSSSTARNTESGRVGFPTPLPARACLTPRNRFRLSLA